jgi:NitT/TauT family transport system ATP-binding protein
MADRIVVLGTHPGHILKVVENKLPRPRDYRSPEFAKLVDLLHEIIMGHEIPDVPEPVLQPNELAPAEPLPDAIPSIMVGVLEYLDAREGKEDVFRIAADTNKEFGEVIKLVKALELLDFVDTPKRDVVLTPDGKRFVKATSQQRQVIWREQLLKLRIFKQVYDMMAKHPRKKIDAEVVQEIIIFNLPSENFEKTFETFTHWARFGNLFAYDEDTQKISFPRKRASRANRQKPGDTNGKDEPQDPTQPETNGAEAPKPVENQAPPEGTLPPSQS